MNEQAVLALLSKIVLEAHVHQNAKVGGPETRLDLPPSWPRLTVWREIVAEAEALIDAVVADGAPARSQ